MMCETAREIRFIGGQTLIFPLQHQILGRAMMYIFSGASIGWWSSSRDTIIVILVIRCWRFPVYPVLNKVQVLDLGK